MSSRTAPMIPDGIFISVEVKWMLFNGGRKVGKFWGIVGRGSFALGMCATILL